MHVLVTFFCQIWSCLHQIKSFFGAKVLRLSLESTAEQHDCNNVKESHYTLNYLSAELFESTERTTKWTIHSYGRRTNRTQFRLSSSNTPVTFTDHNLLLYLTTAFYIQSNSDEDVESCSKIVQQVNNRCCDGSDSRNHGNDIVGLMLILRPNVSAVWLKPWLCSLCGS